MAKLKQILRYIKTYVVTHAPSKETVKQSIFRGLEAGLSAGFISFSKLPINLYDPKKYIIAVLIGFGTGFITGLIKFVRGYIKYDLNQK